MKLFANDGISRFRNYVVDDLLESAADFSPTDDTVLETSIARMNEYDAVLTEVWQKTSSHLGDSHWYQDWICHKNELPRFDTWRPDDFLSLAAFYDILWYVEGVLESSRISIEKANKLACCAAVLRDDSHYVYGMIGDWRVVDLLLKLLQYGMEPNKGPGDSIWKILLAFLYLDKFNQTSSYRETSPAESYVAHVIETFLNYGADPHPIVTLEPFLFESEDTQSCAFKFEICMDEAAGLPSGSQSSLTSETVESQALQENQEKTLSLRFWSYGSPDNKPPYPGFEVNGLWPWWPEHGYQMSFAESNTCHKWVRDILRAADNNTRQGVSRSFRAWLDDLLQKYDAIEEEEKPV